MHGMVGVTQYIGFGTAFYDIELYFYCGFVLCDC